AFKDYTLTETILNQAKCLQGKGFRVEKDFPVEIAEARKRLWPKLKSERANNPRSKLTIVYPAKLIKNGRVIADEFPDWHKVLRTSRVRGFESTGPSEEEISDRESDRGGSTLRKPVFRPWQPRTDSDDVMEFQTCASSDSDTSAIGPTQQGSSQQTRKKVYTKQRSDARRNSELKLTERVKINRENKQKKQLPFTNSSNSKVNPSKSLGKHNDKQRRSSSLPNTTRGRETCKQSDRQDRPIRNENPDHVVQSEPNENTMNGISQGQGDTSQTIDPQTNTQK
ncbi:MAG: hypothetical protein N0E48_03665, partial [Candidatus Thiodiazotropha endolucinida]|nr:hypothetical protein [Candidatus Thiodiazotropha taylori]MCW4342458.1 hypothetical protein [Candidatus Thiodiazotropha endolucinida]